MREERDREIKSRERSVCYTYDEGPFLYRYRIIVGCAGPKSLGGNVFLMVFIRPLFEDPITRSISTASQMKRVFLGLFSGAGSTLKNIHHMSFRGLSEVHGLCYNFFDRFMSRFRLSQVGTCVTLTQVVFGVWKPPTYLTFNRFYESQGSTTTKASRVNDMGNPHRGRPLIIDN